MESIILLHVYRQTCCKSNPHLKQIFGVVGFKAQKPWAWQTAQTLSSKSVDVLASIRFTAHLEYTCGVYKQQPANKNLGISPGNSGSLEVGAQPGVTDP